MMNFSIDESTQNKLYLHYAESLSYFNENQIIGIFLFGIQNYNSIFFDEPVSSKLLTVSSQLTTNQDLIVESTYHKTLENEYVNFENIFLYFDLLTKQDINALEILFSKYSILNSIYNDSWELLKEYRELIARINPSLLVSNLVAAAEDSYLALQKFSKEQQHFIQMYGYNPEQLFQLLRFDEILSKYTNNVPYEDCISLSNPEHFLEIRSGELSEDVADNLAKITMEHILVLQENYFKLHNKNAEILDAKEIITQTREDILTKFRENL